MSTETYTGRVVKTNETGLMLEGQSAYFNYSKYGDAANIQRAAQGDHINVEVSKVSKNGSTSYYIQSLSTTQHEPVRRSVYQEADEGGSGRQQSIERQSSVKSAIDFYTKVLDRGMDKPATGREACEHMLMIAAQIEKWVTRKDE